MMEAKLQKFLEFIRFNTMDFKLRLLKPFSVHRYSLQDGKYRIVLSDNNNDVYWAATSDVDKFLRGKLSNNIVLRMGSAFQEDDNIGYYMSLIENKMDLEEEALQILFGLRFKLNDIFYKIKDVKFKKLSMPNGEDDIMDDIVKIYVVEDFYADDFLMVNKFENTSRTVKKGMGYSMEIDEDCLDDYVLLSDARTAIKIAKKESYNQILSEINVIFPMENKISQKLIGIIKNRLIDDL